MDSQSYPSPISSAAPSPRLTGDSSMANPPPTTRAQRHRQGTQRSLHTAAADLDAAFARLEQVRTSLMQLSSRMPEPMSISPHSRARDQLGPNHGAIMLTGQSDVPPHWEQPTTMNADEMLYEYENSFRRAVQAQNSLAQITQQASALRQSINSDTTPPSQVEPPTHGRHQHRPLPLDSHGSRYLDPTLRDDGFTVLGRHVAAREQASQRRVSDPASTPSTSERPLSPLSSTRSDVARLEPLVEEALTAVEQQRAALAEERLNLVRGQLASPASPPLLWRQDPRRRRLGRTDTRPALDPLPRQDSGYPSPLASDRASRLSMLSSFSGVQNFSSPVSAAPSMTRPLLFEEPESYTDPPGAPRLPRADAELMMLDDIPFGRNYIVRRQMTAEGTERVHNLQLDPTLPEWARGDTIPDFAAEQARRRTMIHSFQERTRTNGMPPPGPLSRRRGWGASTPLSLSGQSLTEDSLARLDSDGNEITSEEEDELEQSRAEYRIRATTRASRTNTGAPTPLFQQTPPLPPYAGSMPQDSSQPAFYGSVTDSVASVQTSRGPRHTPARVSEEKVRAVEWCPLPTPLEEMMPASKKSRYYGSNERETVVYVNPAASFAGR